MDLDSSNIEQALGMLARNLELAGSPPVEIVVCGGASLIALGTVARSTDDVDIVALRDSTGTLVAPVPLPDTLLAAAAVVAQNFDLKPNWLNNGPSRGEGGLFQMGLPDGFADRLIQRVYGPRLTVYFIGRLDQIFFKLFAGADREGVDLKDLRALRPTAEELEAAARWTMTIDVSEGWRFTLRNLLTKLGYEQIAQRI